MLKNKFRILNIFLKNIEGEEGEEESGVPPQKKRKKGGGYFVYNERNCGQRT